MKLARREFGLLSAATLLAPKYIYAAEDKSSLLRPPGAVSEDDFMSRCNRCQKCVQVCPTKVISPASFKFGILNANTPVVSFERSYCNSCLKCSEICPSGSLLPVTKETLDIGAAVIVEKNCVAWDWVGCTVCVDKCPLKAITLDDSRRPVVDISKCNGCGICELECPSVSLRTSITGKGIVVRQRTKDMPARARSEVSEG